MESMPSGLHHKTDEAVSSSLPTSRTIPGGSVMGAVEAALTTAQILATAALRAEAEGKEQEDDRLSAFLDSLPGDGTKETGEDVSRPDSPVSSSGDGDAGDPTKGKDGGSNIKTTLWKSQSVGEVLDVQHANGGEEENAENVNFSQNREIWQRRAASQTQMESSKSIVKSFRSSQEFWEMRQKHTPDLVMDLPLLASSSPKEAGGGKKSLSAVSLSSLSSSSSSGEEESSAAEPVVSPTGPESPDMTTAAERFAKQNQCTLKKNTKASHGASIDAQTQTVKAATKRSKFAASSTVAAMETPNNDMQIPAEVIKMSDNDNLKPSSDTKSQSTESELVPIRSPGPQRMMPKIGGGKTGQGGSLLQAAAVSSFKPQVKVKPQILRKPVLPVPHPHHTQPSPELTRKDKTPEQMN